MTPYANPQGLSMKPGGEGGIAYGWNDRRKKRVAVRRASNVRMARGGVRNALGIGIVKTLTESAGQGPAGQPRV